MISNSKYNDTSKMKLERTPKGNWRCYYDAKDTGNTIDGKLISENLARKLDMYQATVFTGNSVNAIKQAGIVGRMGTTIASISVGEPNKRSGDTPATVITQTVAGAYKVITVSIDSEGKVTKDSGGQSGQSLGTLNDAKSYVEYGRKGKTTFNQKWEDDSSQKSSGDDDDEEKTGADFHVVGANANNVATHLATAMGGKVVGTGTYKVINGRGGTMKMFKVKVGNDTFLVHDGVFNPSYSRSGYARSKGFTIMKEDGSAYMQYKLNGAGTHFTNANSVTAGEVAAHISSTWKYGSGKTENNSSKSKKN